MRAPKPIRLAAVAATALLLVAAGCGGGDDDDATPEPTTSSPSPDIDAAGDFQLVGTVEHAFVGASPDIDIPTGEEDDGSLGSTSTASPQPTASEGFVTPPVNGIMRISLDDASAALRERCSADRDEEIEVFWTTGTEFARRLLGTDIEETLDRRLVGVIGSLYVGPRPDTDDDVRLGETSTQSPAATADAATAKERGCVLIADQVATSTGAIPTARPRATARPTSTPAATRSPTPPPTTAPPTTAPPEETETPEPEETETPEP